MLTAALTAMISDQVPVNQRGVVSAWISAPQAIGLILGDRFWWPRRVDQRPAAEDAAGSAERAAGPVPVGGA